MGVLAHSPTYLKMFLCKIMAGLATMAIMLLQEANPEPQFGRGYPPRRGWMPTWMPQYNMWRVPQYNRPQVPAPEGPPVHNRVPQYTRITRTKEQGIPDFCVPGEPRPDCCPTPSSPWGCRLLQCACPDNEETFWPDCSQPRPACCKHGCHLPTCHCPPHPGGNRYDPRCDGTGKAFCCNWGGNG